jgi:hypothetical protein
MKNWICENEECVKHIHYIIEKLITRKIFKKFKDYLTITRQSKLKKLKTLTYI